MRRPPRALLAAVAVLAALLLCGLTTGCGEQAEGAASADGVEVVAGFAPLAWVAERIGGERVEVTNLTPPGVEPHDLELSARDVATVTEADLSLYLAGFQPAVDEATEPFDPARRLDVSDPGRVEGNDPHVWLDPMRLASIAEAVTERLVELDPSHEAELRARGDALQIELTTLDTELREGLRNCAHHTLVTSHEAFGYLAERYGFDQVGIAGIGAETEPTPGRLAVAAETVNDRQVPTIYFESLVSPKVAETLARETGASTAVLDPIEVLDEGADYLSVMRDNLATLRTGQRCG
ncbi:MAG TPA: metal ABC transporter substrate-binding protein [Microthrixaceae bacterium]|nr:metal ABC transporter substrate-binding protein [Microthrixaceae bacterium]